MATQQDGRGMATLAFTGSRRHNRSCATASDNRQQVLRHASPCASSSRPESAWGGGHERVRKAFAELDILLDDGGARKSGEFVRQRLCVLRLSPWQLRGVAPRAGGRTAAPREALKPESYCATPRANFDAVCCNRRLRSVVDSLPAVVSCAVTYHFADCARQKSALAGCGS